jgi:hypothetical protein
MNSLLGDPADATPHPLSAAHPGLDAVSDSQARLSQLAPDLVEGAEPVDLLHELRSAIRGRGSRKRLDVPPLPSYADFEFTKMKANRERSITRNASAEMKTINAQERMGRNYLAKLHPGKLPRRDHNGYMRVAIYLCDLTWRVMNDRHLADVPQPLRGELRQALRIYIDRHLSKFVREHDDPTTARPAMHKFRYIDAEQADYLADSLATSLIRDWTSDWIEERVRRGHRGREVARPRGPSWDDDDLAILSLFDHLPAREAFAMYNAGRSKARSRATLYRMLDALQERQQPATSRVERSPHAPLTKRRERAFERELQVERDEAYRRAAATEAMAAREREHAEHLARLALLAQRPPEPARDLDALLPA